MALINCKVEFSLKWYEECILSNAGTAATFTITDAKLYVPIVTLKIEDNTKLTNFLNEGFKRSIHWNKYKVIFKDYNNEYIRERIDASSQGVNKLFVLPYVGGDKQKVLDADSREIQQIIFTGHTDAQIRTYYILH